MNYLEQELLEKQILVAETLIEPSCLYKPTITKDGNQFCALLGEDIQSGVCGFGDSPAEAFKDFDKSWHTSIAKKGGKL